MSKAKSAHGDSSFELHIRDLTPDPANARRHTPRNVGMIRDALGEVGAARSIVIDENNVILAGNATIEAAAEADITRVRVVEADGEEIIAVRRTGLTPEQKVRLALFDNRTAELAEWNPEILNELNQARALDGMMTDEELAIVLSEVEWMQPAGAETQSNFAASVNSNICPNCGVVLPRE